jgi:hypothetical protein
VKPGRGGVTPLDVMKFLQEDARALLRKRANGAKIMEETINELSTQPPQKRLN